MKYNENDKVSFGNFLVQVMRTATFGGEIHYGINWHDRQKYRMGWIPVQMLDKDGEFVPKGQE